MKKSKAETVETRRRIVAVAADEFRKNGIQETGLSQVMAAAGLTQGGFYRHFNSKDQLVAEACATGLEAIAAMIDTAARQGDGTGGLRAIVESYLSTDHRDDPSAGCAFAALGSEMARADVETRAAGTAGFRKLVDVIAKQIQRRKPSIAEEQAEFVVCAMVGALTMSRMVTDSELSDAILDNTRKRLVAL